MSVKFSSVRYIDRSIETRTIIIESQDKGMWHCDMVSQDTRFADKFELTSTPNRIGTPVTNETMNFRGKHRRFQETRNRTSKTPTLAPRTDGNTTRSAVNTHQQGIA